MLNKQIPFLEKFAGKTTRMSKQGITGLIQKKIDNVQMTQNIQRNVKRSSIYRGYQKSQPQQSNKRYGEQVNLDLLIPSDLSRRVKNQFYLPQIRNNFHNAQKRMNHAPEIGLEDGKMSNNNYRIKQNDLIYSSVGRLGGSNQALKKISNSEIIKKQKIIEGKDKRYDYKSGNINQAVLRLKQQKYLINKNPKLNQEQFNHKQFFNSLEKRTKIKY